MSETNFPEATEEQIKDGKSIAWLSYLGIFFLIPLLAHKDNPYSKYHARQGMVLFFVEIAIGILWGILGAIAAAFTIATYRGGIGIGLCGGLVWVVMLILWLGAMILAIIGIIQAASGKFWKMPILGGMAEKWFKTMV